MRALVFLGVSIIMKNGEVMIKLFIFAIGPCVIKKVSLFKGISKLQAKGTKGFILFNVN